MEYGPKRKLIKRLRRRANQPAIASCATYMFLPHFDVICDLLLNRRKATWNLFVKFTFLHIYQLKVLFLFLISDSFMATNCRKLQQVSLILSGDVSFCKS